FKSFSDSASEKGISPILAVIRLCRPPRFLTTCLIIQAAAEPHRIIASLGCFEAHVFQNSSNVDKKFDFGVCSHGNSSRKITTFFSSARRDFSNRKIK